jgi:hypothetical protein
MEKLQKSTNGYVKWISRRGEAYDDKEKGLPIGYVGRMMVTHGEDYEPDSEYGNSLIGMYNMAPLPPLQTRSNKCL